MQRRRAFRGRVLLFARLLVFLLTIPLGARSAMPLVARLIAGPSVHVCHCELRGPDAECDCPICNPGRTDLVSKDTSARGACGDDDAAIGDPVLAPCVLPATSIQLFELALVAELTTPPPLVSLPAFEPVTPPPRPSA